MGLLGMFNDPKQAGLMMAAAQMMAQSGPSNRPVGLGEILGGGMGAYMNTKNAMTQQQADEEEREQQRQYRAMQMQGVQQQQDQVRQALQRAQALQQHMAKRQTGQPAHPMQASAEAQGLTMGNAEVSEQPPMQPQENPYQRHMSMADHLRSGGYEAEANEYEDRALKFAPKVKNWQQVRVGDSVMFAPFFEDGTTGKPVPMEIARQMEVRDGGSTNDVIDPITGKLVKQHRKTLSLESASTAQTAANRLAFDREQANAPVFSADLGGFVARPGKGSPQGGFTPLAGTPTRGPKVTEFQGKSGAFGLRATEADKIFSGLDATKYSPARVNSKLSAQDLPLVGGISGVLANNLLSDEDQKAEQAQRDFINAILRQESGAAIGESEFLNARRQYFPQPGDSLTVIQQKARNRQLAIQGLNQNAGPAAMTAAPASGGWSIEKVN